MRSEPSSAEILKRQRSHTLFVLSHPKPGYEPQFLPWYRAAFRQAASHIPGVLSVNLYAQDEIDITQGQWPPPPFRYLGILELSVDGADAAEAAIQRVTSLHTDQGAAEAPATWLYYPVSEKVGRAPNAVTSPLTIAFANSMSGQEAEFREWYATRHIRHALIIPNLVSGQCFERTHFQRPGALAAQYMTIAVYEQEGSPRALMESLAAVPAGALPFPMLDTSRFGESVYQPL